MSTAIETVSNGEQLGAEITELCSYIYAAESRLLTLIREFDEKGFWAQQGLCSCAHWLNFKCGIGMNAAREKCEWHMRWRSACRTLNLPMSNTTIGK